MNIDEFLDQLKRDGRDESLIPEDILTAYWRDCEHKDSGICKACARAAIQLILKVERVACVAIALEPIKGVPHTEYMRGAMDSANRIAEAIKKRGPQQERKQRRLR